jgi:hypothetical protein
MENNVFPQDFNMGTVNKFRDFMVMIKSFQSLQAKMNAFEWPNTSPTPSASSRC